MPLITSTPFTTQVVPGTNITTWNGLDKDSEVTLSNGDTTASIPSGPVVTNVRTNYGATSGKWYVELEIDTLGNGNDLWFGRNGTYFNGSPIVTYSKPGPGGGPYHVMYGTDDNASGAMQATLVSGPTFNYSPPPGF